MREDEIEALLKLDGAELGVYTKGPVCEVGVERYVAVIRLRFPPTPQNPNGIKAFSRSSNVRNDAVFSVWHLYQRYMEGTNKEKQDVIWLYEEAEANIDIKLQESNIEIKLLKGKADVKAKSGSIVRSVGVFE